MSSRDLPRLVLVRHGQTSWSAAGLHTGLTDIPLTAEGEASTRWLREELARERFACVLTSPLQRASRTCHLAGFGDVAEVDPDLVEWDYGDYEGRRTIDIRADRPDWHLFRDGCPGGESPAEVGARADRVLARLAGIDGASLIFSSGHVMRVLAARWLRLEPGAGRYFALATASLSELGYEHDLGRPVIRLWNRTPMTASRAGGC